MAQDPLWRVGIHLRGPGIALSGGSTGIQSLQDPIQTRKFLKKSGPTSGILTPRTYRYVRVRTDLSIHILCSPTSLYIFGRTNISKDVPRHLLIYLYVQVRTFYQNTYWYVLVCTSTGISWYIVVHDSTKRYISIH